MHRVTQVNFNRIKNAMHLSLSEQKDVFDTLKIDPYDNDLEENALAFQQVLLKRDVDYRIDEIIELHGDGYVSEKREEELRAGDAVSAEEREEFYNHIVKDALESDDVNYLVIAKIQSPQKESVHALYSEACLGQGGLHVMDFFGFFPDVKSAEHNLQKMDGIILP